MKLLLVCLLSFLLGTFCLQIDLLPREIRVSVLPYVLLVTFLYPLHAFLLAFCRFFPFSALATSLSLKRRFLFTIRSSEIRKMAPFQTREVYLWKFGFLLVCSMYVLNAPLPFLSAGKRSFRQNVDWAAFEVRLLVVLCACMLILLHVYVEHLPPSRSSDPRSLVSIPSASRTTTSSGRTRTRRLVLLSSFPRPLFHP